MREAFGSGNEVALPTEKLRAPATAPAAPASPPAPTAGGAHLAVLRGGAAGLPEHAPYDRIQFTVGAGDIPTEVLEQLAPGGRLVIPMRIRGSISRSSPSSPTTRTARPGRRSPARWRPSSRCARASTTTSTRESPWPERAWRPSASSSSTGRRCRPSWTSPPTRSTPG
ncbi:hypothetical protein [Streptosporangium sp. NPDC003464]